MGNALSFTNAGSYENVMDFRILDENGADKTSNYDLQIAVGEILISPRPLHITTESVQWQYDGASHIANGYTAEGLLTGHFCEILRSFEDLGMRGGRRADNELGGGAGGSQGADENEGQSDGEQFLHGVFSPSL